MKVFIVTGEKNHGKTRFIKELFESLMKRNISAAGFWSPGVINDEGNKDFEICNLSENKSMHLASRNSRPGYLKMNESFYFNPVAIAFGNNIIEEALKSRSGVVIIDEIGPVELKEKVWYKPLIEVIKSAPPLVIITVRKGLLQDVIHKFNIQDPEIINISETKANEAAEMVLKELL